VQEIAPTGCAVWRGDLYYGSYLDGAIRRLDLPPGTDPRPVAVSVLGEPVYDVAVGPNDRLYVSSPSGIWRLDAPPTGTVSVPASARPSRSYPWWGWLSIAVAGVLIVALVLRLRGRRLAP
jgi:hypothetical protein